MREQELPNILQENWKEYKKRVKHILKNLREVFCKEAEQGVLLDGIERLIMKISGQNVENMNKYTENMTTLVSSLKESIVKNDTLTPKDYSNLSVSASTQSRVTKLMKPVKVPET